MAPYLNISNMVGLVDSKWNQIRDELILINNIVEIYHKSIRLSLSVSD